MIHAFQTITQAYVISSGTGGPVNATLRYARYLYQAARITAQMDAGQQVIYGWQTVSQAVTAFMATANTIITAKLAG